MKTLTADTTENKVTLLLLGLFAASLPFDRFYSELVLLALLAHTAIQLRRERFRAFRLVEWLCQSSVWWLTVLFTAGSAFALQAFPFWERQAALVLLPLCLQLLRFDAARFRARLLEVFVAVNAAVALYLFTDAARTLRYYGQPPAALWSSAYLSHNFAAPLGIHATYLSLFFALSLTFAAQVVLSGRARRGRRLLFLAAILLLGCGLLQLASRAVLIGQLLVALLLLPAALPRRRQRTAWVIGLLLAVAAGLWSLHHYAPLLYQRLVTDLGTDLGTRRDAGSVADPRGSRWRLAWALYREAPLLGQGSGSEVPLLRAAYFEHGLYDSYLHALNAHNQYLSLLLRHGALGLLAWLGSLAFFARRAWKGRDSLLGAFLLLLACTGLSENYLDVNKGIFFYAFFLSLLGSVAKKEAQEARRSNPASRLLVRITKARKPASL